MRWDESHESPDVIDRRGERGGGGIGMGGVLALLPLLGRSKIGIVILLVVVGASVLGGVFGRSASDEGARPAAGPRSDDKQAHFVAFVLDDTQAMWRGEFARHGAQYRNAKLVMFTDATSTACGGGQAATGPFYCPRDERVYIDLAFYRELERRLGAKGDFAQAYVIAHEIGHHVQHLRGIDDKVHALRHGDQVGDEGPSVRLELQADCFAGIWAHSTEQRQLLETGDLGEALDAAAAIGDDKLQRESTGRVRPETFTHGTSAQRRRWFETGYHAGAFDKCDTFSTSVL